MFKMIFLKGSVPLTKTIPGSSYPNVKNFTSIEVNVKAISDFHSHLTKHAAEGHCLLKGSLSHALNDEPRKGCMPPNAMTQWVCFDLDKAPFSTTDEFMATIGFPDVSHITQFSSSYRLNPKDKRLSAHVFVMLNRSMSPQNLKAWLMHLNLSTPVLEQAIALGDSHNFLRWPLDVTTCQADKLIYIAPPTILPPLTDPFKKEPRIQLNPRSQPHIDISSIALKPMDALKKQARVKRDALRDAMGLSKITHKTKIIGEYTVQPGLGEASGYEILEVTDEFTRLNINPPKGDSGAYWYHNADPTLVHNFKGEDSFYMHEVLPDLHKQLTAQNRNNLQSTSATGDLVLAFREKRTGKYHKGLYNAATPSLELHEVDSKDKLHDFLQGHGLVPPPFIPEWSLVFEPQNPVVIDEDNHVCNFFIPPHALTSSESSSPSTFPIIQKALDSAVGTGDVQEHFLNWLAVIAQHKRKTQTAWVLHGKQGTGKGILFNHVIAPLFTRNYTTHILASALASDFDGWQENKLLCFIDEIEVDMFDNKKSGVEAKLKKLITEDTDDIHRKGVTRYTVPSYVNLIFGSNKPHMVQVPSDDRRYNIGAYQAVKWTPSRHEIENLLPQELPAFAHYLMTRTACIDTARTVLLTEDRDQLQRLNLTSVDELAHDILTGNIDKLLSQVPSDILLSNHGVGSPYAQPYYDLMRIVAQQLPDRLSRDQLMIIFSYCIGKVTDSPNKFTTYLRHHGIHVKDMKFNGVLQKGIRVNWQKANPDYMARFEPKLNIQKLKVAK
jgi:hypothetical protein